jgi:hypothetical protein
MLNPVVPTVTIVHEGVKLGPWSEKCYKMHKYHLNVRSKLSIIQGPSGLKEN